MFEGAQTIRRTQVEFAESYARGAWVDTDDLNNKKQGDTMASIPNYIFFGQGFCNRLLYSLGR